MRPNTFEFHNGSILPSQRFASTDTKSNRIGSATRLRVAPLACSDHRAPSPPRRADESSRSVHGRLLPSVRLHPITLFFSLHTPSARTSCFLHQELTNLVNGVEPNESIRKQQTRTLYEKVRLSLFPLPSPPLFIHMSRSFCVAGNVRQSRASTPTKHIIGTTEAVGDGRNREGVFGAKPSPYLPAHR